MENIYDIIKNEINTHTNGNSEESNYLLSHLNSLKDQKLNILFVGATGVGKSSTINAIFDKEIATVGEWVSPETSIIDKYEIDNLILWDTPGLGDTPEKDNKYAKSIASLLTSKDEQGHFMIDAVVVLVNATSKDLGTVYEMLNKVIVPYLHDNKRIIIAINQADIAMSGRNWDYDNEVPNPVLLNYLEEKVVSVKHKINSIFGIDITPVYYSATHHYNISKLLLAIMKAIPLEKRYMIAPGLNKDPEIWKRNNTDREYNSEIKKEMEISLTGALKGAEIGAVAGASVGTLVPVIGTAIGAAVGAALGFLGGLFGK